jgi:hypothetical protein
MQVKLKEIVKLPYMFWPEFDEVEQVKKSLVKKGIPCV